LQDQRVYTARELSDLLLRLCHDLRAPARAVRTQAELFLRANSPPAESAERLGFLVDGARKIDQIVEVLSSYSLALRIDPASFQLTALDGILRNVRARLREQLQAHQAEVIHEKLPRVWGDADRLMELFLRLIGNALQRRGTASPRIHIAAAKQDNGWLVTVEDNAPATSTAYVESFDHNPISSSDGAEPGLAICRMIVERHGGELRVESTGGRGTKFRFTLPEDTES